MISGASRHSYDSEELYAAWVDFVYNDKINTNVRPDVLQSWKRCKKLNVDPTARHFANVLEEENLQGLLYEKRDLIRIARPYVNLLNQYVKNSGFIIILSDENGTVLVLEGDEEQLCYQKKINLVEGAIWTEQGAGTNAVGTSLFLRQPMQIVGAEHFCVNQHRITCSGAPIYGPDGKLVGLLNMSGASENVNIHTLGMVVASAVAIQNQLKIENTMEELSKNNSLVNTALENIPNGIITVDEEGIITQLNDYGAKLLNMDNTKVVGKHIKQFLPSEIDITRFLQKNASTFEYIWEYEKNNKRINITSSPILSTNSEYVGSVLVLKPREKVHELVNQVTGAHAEFSFDSIIGANREIKRIKEVANAAAMTNSTVLLLGESGTGKELFAQAIHRASHRPGAFIEVNCSAIPRSLIESELFGYEAGAFTGANRNGRPGKFERAHQGTILLDEIGDMPLDLQAVLLRVLQEKTIVRVGGYKPIPVDVRVIAATNSDLIEKIKEGSFREDLYFRLNVINIEIPPLRERKDDITRLVEYLLPQINRRLNRNITHVSPEVMEALQNYEWPGNVRELENTLERSVVVASQNILEIRNLPAHFINNDTKNAEKIEYDFMTLSEIEKKAIKDGLQKVDSIAELARLLGISRSTLYRKMKEYDL